MSQYELQPYRSRPAEEEDLRDLWGAIRHGWLTIMVVVLLSIGVAGAISWLMAPSYEGTATLRLAIQDETGGMLSQLSPLAQIGLPGMGSDEIDTDMGVLQSRSIAEEVVDSLHLHVQILSPNTPRDSILQIVSAPIDVEPGRYRLTPVGGGAYSVEGVGNVTPGSPFALGGVSLVLHPRGLEDEEIVVELLLFDSAVDEMREDLSVERQRGSSTLVDIEYRSPDRLLAAAVPNAVSSAFLRHTISTSKLESLSRVAVLRSQVAAYEQKLLLAEENLRQYRQLAQLVEPTTQASEQVRRLSLIQADRDAMRVEREALSRVLARIEATEAGSDDGSAYRQLASFPSFVTNQGVQEILQSLIALENDRADLLVRRTAESADIQGIDRRIEQLERQLHDFGTSYLRGLETQISSATDILTGFDQEIARMPAIELEYLRRLREQEMLVELYTYLQTRLQEAEIEEATELGSSRLLDAARVPRSPVSPNLPLNVGLASVLGLLIGATLVIGRRLADTKVRTPIDAELASGIPVLGVIPAGRAGIRLGVRQAAARESGSERKLPTVAAPDGRILEAYNSLGALMRPRGGGEQSRILLVSKTNEAEDSATVAANLALSLAGQDHRVLLVDADLRAGRLGSDFGFENDPGMIQLLEGSADLASVLRTTEVTGSHAQLFFLPSGRGSANGRNGVGSNRIADLLLELRNGFDIIVVSAPPTTRLHELLDVGEHVDAAILAAHVGITDKADLENAARLMHQLDLPVRGIVLRDPDVNSSWSVHRVWLPNLRIQQNGQPH